ncbi:MAG: hypothetical protein D6753_07980 [Planctomycetota bacterium]|nr:MAG: hypothetical protein D6753_07980 [Planctomycetota bacterium]
MNQRRVDMNHSDDEKPEVPDVSPDIDQTLDAAGLRHDDNADFSLHKSAHQLDSADLRETMERSGPDQHSRQPSRSADSSVVEETAHGTVPSAPEEQQLSEAASCQIPGFRLVEELGRGTFGVVYRAVDLALDREVAIKVPLLRNPALAHKYIEEARNAARIDAVGIVPVYQVGSTPTGQPFVVQKLIEGRTLKQLSGSGQLGLMRALDIMRRLAIAIHTAHQSGLVHRDLKPENVLIDQQGQPWVADFGLAVFEDDQASRRGEVAGTPRYMAPEQFEGRADWLDGRCDIWALGVMLYELVVGRPPFAGQTLADLQEQILYRDPRPISQRVDVAPAELDEIFHRCCAKDVSERYPNAAELAADLAAVMIDPSLLAQHTDSNLTTTIDIIDPVPVGAQTVRGRPAAPPLPASAWQAAWRWWAAAGTAVVALAAVFISVSRQDAGDATSAAPRGGQPLLPAAPTGSPNAPTASPTAQPEIASLVAVDRTQGPIRTLQAALQLVAEGGVIQVHPGVYRENLEISRDVTLIGLGGRDSIRLLGGAHPACRITGGCTLRLENITVESSGEQVNTIELQDGHLTAQSCRLRSWGYDCIKAHPGTSLVASSCDFESDTHPAIVAKQARVELDRSTFRFAAAKAGIDRAAPVTAIELTECGGTCKGCTFVGVDKIGKGLSCRDTDEPVVVHNCAFTGLQHGIELFRCDHFEVAGGTRISGCNVGLYAESSTGQWSDVQISGCDVGSTLRAGSRSLLTNVAFRDNREVGLWLRDSSVEAEQCQVTDHPTVGWLIDSLDATTTSARGVEIENNAIGVLLVQGTVELIQSRVSQNRSAGIAIVAGDQLSAAFSRPAPEQAVPPTLVARQTTFNARLSAPAVLFNITGRYHFEDCTFVDLPNHHRPALAPHLTSRGEGQWTLVVPRP